MHNNAKFPLAHMVQEKNAGSGLKKYMYAFFVMFSRSAKDKST